MTEEKAIYILDKLADYISCDNCPCEKVDICDECELSIALNLACECLEKTKKESGEE